MSEENIATVQAVIRTLNSIPVQGLEAMSRLLGCAQALQQIITTDGDTPPEEREIT